MSKTPDEIITEFITTDLNGEQFESLNYSDDELKAAMLRAGARDLSRPFYFFEKTLKGREAI